LAKHQGIKLFHRQRKQRQFCCLASVVFFLVLGSVIPLRLAISHYQAPFPQAIFVLGGEQAREQFTAQFAQRHPRLPIWISSGIRPAKTREIFQVAKIPTTQLHIDCRAVDTVTNFTALVAEFKQRNVQHLYLITADFHMPRAKAIATLVLGSQGIAFTPVSASIPPPSSDYHSPESWLRTLRDSGRALLWMLTGRSGASLNPKKVTPCV
jgi:uncharacterized SAM-binding protein YcdF (DUF218 family)